MPRTTSFILDEHFEQFIADQVGTGRFASASEVMREGLRLIEERQKRIAAFDAAIDEGIASGIAEDFSWDQVREMGKAASGREE